jgi:hypothetical protein
MLVIVQKWEESERNWGVRPDGYSIHLTEADRKAYIKEYWDRMPNETPDEYSRPAGTPYTAEVDDVKITGHGIRFNGNNYPGSGGTDGWVSTGHGSTGKIGL